MKENRNRSEHGSDIDLDSSDKEARSKVIPDKLKKAKKPPPVAQSMNEEVKNSFLPPLLAKTKAKEESAVAVNVPEATTLFKEKPVQLVRINHDIGKFQVCEQGLKMLQGIEGNIGIVAFTGLYRTGKSFTLNLLLDKLGKGVRIGFVLNNIVHR